MTWKTCAVQHSCTPAAFAGGTALGIVASGGSLVGPVAASFPLEDLGGTALDGLVSPRGLFFVGLGRPDDAALDGADWTLRPRTVWPWTLWP